MWVSIELKSGLAAGAFVLSHHGTGPPVSIIFHWLPISLEYSPGSFESLFIHPIELGHGEEPPSTFTYGFSFG